MYIKSCYKHKVCTHIFCTHFVCYSIQINHKIFYTGQYFKTLFQQFWTSNIQKYREIATICWFVSMWRLRSFSTTNSHYLFVWRNSDLLSSLVKSFVYMHYSLTSPVCAFRYKHFLYFLHQFSRLLLSYHLKSCLLINS